MPTGACGINCDVCRLRLLGTCSSYSSGKSLEAETKLEAQKRIFGGNCAILACASMNQISYCLRDCDSFPCENFTQGDYPFSQGFLNIQARRLREIPLAFDPHGHRVKVPPEYWDRLQNKDLNSLCNFTLGNPLQFQIKPLFVEKILHSSFGLLIQRLCWEEHCVCAEITQVSENKSLTM